MTVSKELSQYKLDLVELQEVRKESGRTQPARASTSFYEMENENHEFGTRFFVHKKTISAVHRVEFASDRITN
jgi:hypothetical protein